MLKFDKYKENIILKALEHSRDISGGRLCLLVIYLKTQQIFIQINRLLSLETK